MDIVNILEKQRKCLRDIDKIQNILEISDDSQEEMCGIFEYDGGKNTHGAFSKLVKDEEKRASVKSD